MSDAALQIALDHHRAGRLQQAAGGYRALIDADPRDAEAHHWLGVLAFQAGRADRAIPLLERAVALKTDDAAYLHNLAQAYLSAGRAGEAVGAFERAAKLVPDRAETLYGWGLAHLVRGAAGDATAAVFAFRQARLAGLDSAELHHHLGLAHLAGTFADDAIEALNVAMAKAPDDAAVHHHLAVAYRQKGDDKAVRKHLNKALELDPTRARDWYALASLDAELGNHDIAVGLFRKAIKFRPNYPASLSGLGRALEQSGRRAEALAAFAAAARAARAARVRGSAPVAPALETAVSALERKLTAPKAVEMHHAMAAQASIFSPAHVPPTAVAALFDQYAETFDDHLRGTLRYGVPELIAEAVARAVGPDAGETPFFDVLDLGCGTGLCGPLLRPLASNLCGVDLSPLMIEKSRARGVYDQLEVGELVETLRKVPQGFDLLTAADVLIYIGDLGPTFEAARDALRPGGLMAFTVEAGGGERYHLHQKTLRFTHGEAYLKRLIKLYGFEEVEFGAVPLRTQTDKVVAGWLVVLRVGAGRQ